MPADKDTNEGKHAATAKADPLHGKKGKVFNRAGMKNELTMLELPEESGKPRWMGPKHVSDGAG